MQADEFDFVIIGGGSAGYAAARTAREESEHVAIVDDSVELGGLCILRGCMPSKTLIYSAEILHAAQIGARFGLRIPVASADMAEVHARKVRMIDDFKSYRQEQLQSDRFTLFRERATFVDKNTIELQPSGRKITAKTFLYQLAPP
jgi:pyruvate/2-oxoglutarate dehydrogenase complex dihydrolipoamide dehydrogenase (E3) component|tara:strand:+ start:240 stop:677 length:438 start_codon:yes stop_codon:yes gene_type:complete